MERLGPLVAGALGLSLLLAEIYSSAQVQAAERGSRRLLLPFIDSRNTSSLTSDNCLPIVITLVPDNPGTPTTTFIGDPNCAFEGQTPGPTAYPPPPHAP